jgi:hypothetical protein
LLGLSPLIGNSDERGQIGPAGFDPFLNASQDRMQWKLIVICAARQHLNRMRVQP